jgi:hypothetical protein
MFDVSRGGHSIERGKTDSQAVKLVMIAAFAARREKNSPLEFV